jgi:hypothetical protein
MAIIDHRQKQETVRTYLINFMNGNISMDLEMYRNKRPRKFTNKFHKYFKIFGSHDALNLVDDDVSKEITKVTNWLYDSILKGRVCGAIKGVVKKDLLIQDKEAVRDLQLMIKELELRTAELQERNCVLENELDNAQSRIFRYENMIANKEHNEDIFKK